MKFHHIGLVVSDLSKSSKILKSDFKIINTSKIYTDKKIEVKLRFIDLNNNTKLELIQPLNNKSPIKRFLDKKNTSTIHHLAYTCKDIDKTCNNFRKKGYGFLTNFFHAEAFNGSRVIFLLSPLNFIVELIEN